MAYYGRTEIARGTYVTVEKKIKVVIIASVGNPPYLGGIENVIDTLVNSCLADRYEFLLFDTYRKPDPNRSIFEKSRFACGLFVNCGRFLLSNKPEIVHIHFCSNNDFRKQAICLFVSRILGFKAIFHLHGGSFEKVYNNYHSFAQMVVRSVFRMPHCVIALSEYWAVFLSKIMNSERLRVVNNPIDCEKLSPPSDRSMGETVFKVLLLGRVGMHKGHYDVLKALPIVLRKYSNVVVLFAGTDDIPGATEDLKSLAKEYRIDDNVKFLGPVTGSAKEELLHSCSIMILPSHGENMPLSVMEGMAAKLPIIATSVGAIPELLENGRLGILIDVGDYEALAEGIIRLLEQPDLAESYAHQGYMKIRGMCDVKKIAGDLDLIYHEVMRL